MVLQKPLLAFAALFIAGSAARVFAGPTSQPSPASSTPTSNSVAPGEFKAVALLDDDDDNERLKTSTAQTAVTGSTRYFFGLLDLDKETQVEVDYRHAEDHGRQTNEAEAEMEWNAIGELTLAAEFFEF